MWVALIRERNSLQQWFITAKVCEPNSGLWGNISMLCVGGRQLSKPLSAYKSISVIIYYCGNKSNTFE